MAIKNRTVSLCLTLSKKEILIQIEDLNTLVQLGSQVHGKEKMSARDAINWPLKALKPPKKASKERAVSSNPKHYPPSSSLSVATCKARPECSCTKAGAEGDL